MVRKTQNYREEIGAMSTPKRTRRDFLKATVMGAASLAIPGCMNISERFAGKKQRKPNLLFIWTDEQRADTMAAYDNTRIHTPNLNKLAGQSVVFKNAYVTQPVCSPNRSAVMTGLWPHTSGITRNNIPLSQDTPCLPELLGDNDYRTAYMGKWHLGDEIFAQHGFEEWVSIEDLYTRYYQRQRDKSIRSSYHHFLIRQGYKPDLDDNKFSRGFAARLPLEHSKPKFLETKACDFLRRHRSEPFMLYINFLEPHMPFFGPLDDEHDLKTVNLPASFADPLEENEPLRYRLLREYHRTRYGKDADNIRRLIAKYWGLVTQVDLSVGAILKTLDDLGLAENTIVVYTSDHGDMMGAHNMVEKGVMYEEAVRIPWLMRIPQMGKRPRVVRNNVSHIDMVPTLLELMGSKAGRFLPGQSLVPLIQGGDITEDEDYVFIEWNPGPESVRKLKDPGSIASEEDIQRVRKEHTRAVISSDGWKLCLSDADKCQLFNLNNDPGETTNLFDSGHHRDVISRLMKKIYQWQEKVQDNIKV
ncbi:MAG: sulfatase-like hydrolase/transferase [Planctomycetota bacterium]|jgi:arylsulfatase A-like enzyme